MIGEAYHPTLLYDNVFVECYHVPKNYCRGHPQGGQKAHLPSSGNWD